MAIKLISIKCPDCGATLKIEEGRNQFFCSYCGAKILLDNDNEYIFRHIDEARIKESENRKSVEMRELDLEERKYQFYVRSLKIGYSVSVAMLVGGIIGLRVFKSSLMGYVAFFGFILLLFTISHQLDHED